MGKRVSARQSRELTGRESLKRRQVRPRIWMPPPQIWDDDGYVTGGLTEVKATFGPVSIRIADEMGELARHVLHGDGCHLYLHKMMQSQYRSTTSYFFTFSRVVFINQEKLLSSYFRLVKKTTFLLHENVIYKMKVKGHTQDGFNRKCHVTHI